MAYDLTVHPAPLLPVDPDAPAFLSPLPAWLESRRRAECSSENQRTLRDAQGRPNGRVGTLPASLKLTGTMRTDIARRIAALEAAARPGPPETILEMIARVMTRYGVGSGDTDLAAVRAEDYLEALEDLPAWAVREAIRRWRHGEGGGTLRDRAFAPSEAQLRAIAKAIAAEAAWQAQVLRRILAAEVEPEIPAAVRAQWAARAEQVLLDLRDELRACGSEPDPPSAPDPQLVRDRAAVAADLEQRRQRRLQREAADQRTPEHRPDQPGGAPDMMAASTRSAAEEMENTDAVP